MHGGYAGLPVGTAYEAVGCLSSSPFHLRRERWRRGNNKKQNPESKDSEWTWKLTNLFCVCFQGVSAGREEEFGLEACARRESRET